MVAISSSDPCVVPLSGSIIDACRPLLRWSFSTTRQNTLARVTARKRGIKLELDRRSTTGHRHQVCFALLQAGADKTARDSKGETAQHLAECRQRGKVVTLLDGWRPLGLTATQTQKIKESRGEGPLR